MVSAVLVKVDPGTTPADVALEIQKQVPGTRTITPDGLLNAVSGQLGAVTRILYGSTLAVMIVSIPLLGVISAMVAHERTREVAILQALGATKGYVRRLMLAESFSLSIYRGSHRHRSRCCNSCGFPGFYCIWPENPFYHSFPSLDTG